MLLRIALAAAWVAALLVTRALILAAATTPPPTLEWLTPGHTVEPPDVRDGGATRLDLHGNPIEPALGHYRIDRSGDLYEEHAPETAVAGLGAPSV